MDGEIQLISDGDGVAVIGDPTAVELFLESEELASRDLELPRLSLVLQTGSGAAQAGSEIAANSGRWVKLSKESAEAMKKYGLRDSKKSGLQTGVIKGDRGQVRGFVEFVKTPGSVVTNPSVLAGAAGLMAQLAMQHAMDEITDYLARIDAKLDEVLRAQKDAVLAEMVGVGLDLEEAMTLRKHQGRVNEVTWSKIQGVSSTISSTQAYALRQLDALTEKVEKASRVGDIVDAVEDVEAQVGQWLGVLARCVQLRDALAVLELDRVLAMAPDDLDGHRMGLRASRQQRLDTISRATEGLLERMNSAASTANMKVLFHPSASRAAVHSTNKASSAVLELHERLGIEGGRPAIEARRWVDAAAETRGKVVGAGVEGVLTVRRVGGETAGRVRSTATDRVEGLRGRLRDRRASSQDPEGSG